MDLGEISSFKFPPCCLAECETHTAASILVVLQLPFPKFTPLHLLLKLKFMPWTVEPPFCEQLGEVNKTTSVLDMLIVSADTCQAITRLSPRFINNLPLKPSLVITHNYLAFFNG